jgi:hypothetical protein
LLHRIDREKPQPVKYRFGSRGPVESDELVSRAGYVRSGKYTWVDPALSVALPAQPQQLEAKTAAAAAQPKAHLKAQPHPHPQGKCSPSQPVVALLETNTNRAIVATPPSTHPSSACSSSPARAGVRYVNVSAKAVDPTAERRKTYNHNQNGGVGAHVMPLHIHTHTPGWPLPDDGNVNGNDKDGGLKASTYRGEDTPL